MAILRRRRRADGADRLKRPISAPARSWRRRRTRRRTARRGTAAGRRWPRCPGRRSPARSRASSGSGGGAAARPTSRRRCAGGRAARDRAALPDFLGATNGLTVFPPTPPPRWADLRARTLAGVHRVRRGAARLRGAGQPRGARGSGATSARCATTRSRPSLPGCTSRACRCWRSSSARRARGWPAGCRGRHVTGGAGRVPAGAVGRAAHRRDPRRARQPGRRGLGAAALALIPTWADDASGALGLSTNVQANLALAVYGAVLIGVMLAAPRGIQGALGALAPQSGGGCDEVAGRCGGTHAGWRAAVPRTTTPAEVVQAGAAPRPSRRRARPGSPRRP